MLYGFPGEDPGEYEKMAELIPSLLHLRYQNRACPEFSTQVLENFE